jgi:hypothetical protein
MRRFMRPGGRVAVALAVVGCVLGIGVSTADAAPASLTVSILPNALTAGNQGVAQATFHNSGTRLTSAALFLTFSKPVAVVPTAGCHSLAPLFPKTVACLLGIVGPNASATRTVQFTVPSTGSTLTVNGLAGYLDRGPLGIGVAKGSATALIFPAGAGMAFTPPPGQTVQTETTDCLGQNDSASSTYTNSSYENGSAGTDVTATGLDGLPCAPVVTGVATDNSDGKTPNLFVKAPLGQQFTVVLTFPDEYLPWPDNEDGVPPPEGFDDSGGFTLFEWPNYPDTSTQVTVPPCNEDGSIPTSGEGSSTDSCVVSVDGGSDPDEDFDAGTITLHTVGTGADPGYHG